MKNRKSKSDRLFRIDYRVRTSEVVKFKNNSGGWEVREGRWTPQPPKIVVAHNRAAAVKGFLWGMDRNNITINRCVCCIHLEPNL